MILVNETLILVPSGSNQSLGEEEKVRNLRTSFCTLLLYFIMQLI